MMDLKVFNRLAIIGVVAVAIGNTLYRMDNPHEAYEIQKQAIMDIRDVVTLEDEVKERRRKGQREVYYKNYKFVIK